MAVEANQILTFGADPLRPFREATEALTAGQRRTVRVVHLGDSHLQADLLTARVRDAWQADYGSAGRGLVFPYALARTNNPYDYRVIATGTWLPRRSAIPAHHSNWGLAGLAGATATAGATFTLRLVGATAARSPVARVRVFYPLDDSASYRLELVDSAGVAAYRPDYTAGCGEWTLRAPVTTLTFRVRQTRPGQRRLILQGLHLESDTPGLDWSVAGGNGATVASYLRCGRLRRQLAVLNPDLVVVSLGTNDVFGGSFDSVAFRRDVGTFLQMLQRAAPQAALLLTTPGDTYRNGRPNAARTAAATRILIDVAEQTDCAVWDFNRVMGGANSIPNWTATGLAQRDYVHYTLRGYQLQADLLTIALRAALVPIGPVAPRVLLKP